MHNVFVSYAREDLKRITPLISALKSKGWEVFWDQKIGPGETWRNVIGREITVASCVIVVWTHVSVEREWVIEEAETAKNLGTLLPICLDDVKPPIGFRQVQAANLTGWSGDAEDTKMRSFLNHVGRFLASFDSRKCADEVDADAVVVAPQSVIQPLDVLIVEVSEFQRKLVATALSNQGHTLHIADCGKQAIESVRVGKHDLVLLPVNLPGELDGCKTADAIRSLERNSGVTVPVVIFGMSNDSEQETRCRAAGMDCLLPRPASGSALAEAIRDYVVVIDLPKFRSSMQNPEIAEQLLAICLSDFHDYFSKIRAAIEDKDHGQLHALAHSLAGMIGTLSAHQMLQTSKRLSTVGRNGGDWSDAELEFTAIHRLGARLIRQISRAVQ